MAKLSAICFFALSAGACAAANQRSKQLSLLDHEHEVNGSVSLYDSLFSVYWGSTPTYRSECGMKRAMRLSDRAMALIQKGSFPRRAPSSEINGDGDGDDYGDGDGDYGDGGDGEITGDGDGDYGDGGDGEITGDGDGDYGDGDGDYGDGGDGEITGPPPPAPPPATPPSPPPAPPSPPPPDATVLKDGFLRARCVKDYMYYHGDKYGAGSHAYKLFDKSSILRYDMAVKKEDQEEMTPKVCFEFCRVVPNMGFFGLLNGRTCYCAPYYRAMAGDSSMCDSVCPGDNTNFCGGKSKSQIFEMHMCSSAEDDLTESTGVASKEGMKMNMAVTAATTLASEMQSAAEKLQKSFGAVGDSAAADLMQKAKVTAGNIEHQAQKVHAVVDKLTSLTDKSQSGTGDVRQAEGLTESIDKALSQGRTAADKLEKLMDASTSSPDPFIQDAGAAKQYYPLMYFVNKDFAGVPSTCSGESVGETIADVSVDGCAWACDENVNSCVGFSYFAQEKLCFLMSRFNTASYYTGCKASLSQLGFLQQKTSADVACMAKFSEFGGTTLKPDPSGKCKRCLKTITKADRCYK